jgi:hypothetical protein
VRDRYRYLIVPLAAFALTRLLLFGAGYFAEVALHHPAPPDATQTHPQNVVINIWSRWDSRWYLDIADNGYSYDPNAQSNVVFFPLYPLTVRAVNTLVNDTPVAALLVSHVSLLAALIVLYQLALDVFGGDDGAATRAVYYTAAFPTAFFFSAVYTESLFLLVSVTSVWAARRRWWWLAAVMAALAGATRVVGSLLWGVMVLEWLHSVGWYVTQAHTRTAWRNLWDGLRREWWVPLVSLLSLAGLGGYMLYLWRTFDDPLLFSHAQVSFGRQFMTPVAVLRNDFAAWLAGDIPSGYIPHMVLIEPTAWLIAVALVIPVWRRFGETFALYTLLSLLIPMTSSSQSMTRYLLVLFPLMFLFAAWGEDDLLDRAFSVGFAVLMGTFSAIFVNWAFFT